MSQDGEPRQRQKKFERYCLRCGHERNMHDDQAGSCSGVIAAFSSQVLQAPDQQRWCGCQGFVPQREFSLRSVMDVHDRVWSDLMGHSSPDPAYLERRIRPSSLGYCLLRQLLYLAGVKQTRVETEDEAADRERRFAWGRDLEDHLRRRVERAGLLIAHQVRLEDLELNTQGNMDFMWGGLVQRELPPSSRWWSAPYAWTVRTVREEIEKLVEGPLPITGTEVKTTHSYAVRKAFEEGPRFDYRCQAGAYFLLAQRVPEQLPVPLDRMQIVVVGRDAVRPLIFDATNAEVGLAEERIGLLNEALRTGEWPPCECGHTDGMAWESKYCPYPNTDGDGCCGYDLYRKLQASVEATG